MQQKIYPVITLYQPWATWIMWQWKLIETRLHERFKCLNGETILIHAGKTSDATAWHTATPYITTAQMAKNKPEEIINGHILGSVFVHDFAKLNASHSKDALIDCGNTERFGLFLKDVEFFKEPIPETGGMGIWYYNLENKQKVKKPQMTILRP